MLWTAGQFDRLTALEQSIMFWLVLHREWVDLDALQADLIPATTPAKFLEALESLCWRSLIEQRSGKYTQQTVVMEYVSDRLIDEICGEITNQVRLSLFQSHILIQATAAHLVRKFSNLANIQVSQKLEFSVAGEQQFVQALPWRDELGLDWLIVVVLPESDFMEHIHANARSTILLCLAAFFSSMYMASLTSRWLATPILQLSKASKQITEGDLKQSVEITPPLSWLPQIGEVEELAASFNRMSGKLQDSFEALETTNTELESRIEQRTVELRTSLAEKEILLREIHHRVKNNLHVISNLLDLQADSIQDERVLSFLSDSQDRIQAMALIHEHLYQSNHSGLINIDDYIQRLVENLLFSYSEVNGNVRAILEIEPVKLAIETAIPCGLLINELVTNSLKYAFPNHQTGEIHIELHQEVGQKLHLYVWDNGIGIPDSLDWQNSNSLGLKLIGLFSQQLRADMHHAFANGVFFHFAFELLKYTPRF